MNHRLRSSARTAPLILSAAAQDVKRLYYPTDYTGNLCGINNGTDGNLRSEGNLANFSKAAFPRLVSRLLPERSQSSSDAPGCCCVGRRTTLRP